MSHRKPHSEIHVHQLNKQSSTNSPLLAGQVGEKAQRQQPRNRRTSFPYYLAFLAAFGSVVCWVLAGVVLYKASGDLVSLWDPQPSVYLATLSVLAAICLRSAKNHASAAQFWANVEDLDITGVGDDDSQTQENGNDQPRDRQNDKDDLRDRIQRYDRLWRSSHSVWSAIPIHWGEDKKLSALGLASILFALLPASSPLLQRASRPQAFNETSNYTFPLPIREALDGNLTGIIDGKTTTSLTQGFANIISTYGVTGIIPNDDIVSCPSDDCSALLEGFGLYATCIPSKETKVQDTSANNSLSVFDVTFTPGGSEHGLSYLMTLQTVWKSEGTFSPDTNECSSIIQKKNCTFSSALLGYNATIGNFYTYLSTKTNYTSDLVLNSSTGDPFSYWSGIYFLLDQLYTSSATLAYSDDTSNVTLQGFSAVGYLDDADRSPCDKTWADPTDDLLNLIRQITFTTTLALGAINSSSIQQVTVNTTNYQIFRFKSDYTFLGLALTLSVLSLMVVLFMAWQGDSSKWNASWSPMGLVQLIRPELKLRQEHSGLLKWLLKLDGDDDDSDNGNSS